MLKNKKAIKFVKQNVHINQRTANRRKSNRLNIIQKNLTGISIVYIIILYMEIGNMIEAIVCNNLV